jgi:hypothetical protein
MRTPQSIGLRDTLHEHQSRVPSFQATLNQKKFQASFVGAGDPRHTARGIRWIESVVFARTDLQWWVWRR